METDKPERKVVIIDDHESAIKLITTILLREGIVSEEDIVKIDNKKDAKELGSREDLRGKNVIVMLDGNLSKINSRGEDGLEIGSIITASPFLAATIINISVSRSSKFSKIYPNKAEKHSPFELAEKVAKTFEELETNHK